MWIGTPLSVTVTSFLMKSVLLSRRGVEFGFLGFVVTGSLRVQWQRGSGGSVAGGVVKVGVEVEDDGCVSSLHSGSFNKV